MAIEGLVNNATGLAIADADTRYELAGGTTERLVVDVGVTATKTSVTGDGTEWKIEYDNSSTGGTQPFFNPISIWNTSTYEGTIPTDWDGYYMIRIGWHLGSTPGIVSTNNKMTLKVVRSSGGLQDHVCRTIGNVWSYNNNQAAGLIDVDSIIIPLSATDKFWATLTVAGTGKGIGFQNDFVTRLQALYLGPLS